MVVVWVPLPVLSATSIGEGVCTGEAGRGLVGESPEGTAGGVDDAAVGRIGEGARHEGEGTDGGKGRDSKRLIDAGGLGTDEIDVGAVEEHLALAAEGIAAGEGGRCRWPGSCGCRRGEGERGASGDLIDASIEATDLP